MLRVSDREGRALATVSLGQVVLWVVIWGAELASVMTMVGVAAAHVSRGLLWPAAVVILLAAIASTVPDSAAGLLTLLVYGVWWLVAVRSVPWPAVLLVAVAALVLHLALAHAAAAPPGARSRAGVVSAVARDAGLVVVLTGVAAIVAAVLDRSGVHAPAFLIGVALLLVAVLPWVALDGGRR